MARWPVAADSRSMDAITLAVSRETRARSAVLRKRALRLRLEAALEQDRAMCLVLHAQVAHHLVENSPLLSR